MFGKTKMRPRLLARAKLRRLPLGKALNRLGNGWETTIATLQMLGLIASPPDAHGADARRCGARRIAMQAHTPHLHEVA
jgi:hypothetical protein